MRRFWLGVLLCVFVFRCFVRDGGLGWGGGNGFCRMLDCGFWFGCLF